VASAAPMIALTLAFSGFTQPIFMAQPNDGTTRYFVVERTGRIWIRDSSGRQATPFLDLRLGRLLAGTFSGYTLPGLVLVSVMRGSALLPAGTVFIHRHMKAALLTPSFMVCPGRVRVFDRQR
jgi:hypothetical protein